MFDAFAFYFVRLSAVNLSTLIKMIMTILENQNTQDLNSEQKKYPTIVLKEDDLGKDYTSYFIDLEYTEFDCALEFYLESPIIKNIFCEAFKKFYPSLILINETQELSNKDCHKNCLLMSDPLICASYEGEEHLIYEVSQKDLVMNSEKVVISTFVRTGDKRPDFVIRATLWDSSCNNLCNDFSLKMKAMVNDFFIHNELTLCLLTNTVTYLK